MITKANLKEFSSDDVSERFDKLFKKINISRFAEEHSLARKTLYKMRDSGIMPRALLLDLCKEAEVNPALIEFSPQERLFYFERLSEYVKCSEITDLYKLEVSEALERGDQSFITSLALTHKLYKSGDLHFQAYLKQLEELLLENKSVE